MRTVHEIEALENHFAHRKNLIDRKHEKSNTHIHTSTANREKLNSKKQSAHTDAQAHVCRYTHLIYENKIWDPRCWWRWWLFRMRKTQPSMGRQSRHK